MTQQAVFLDRDGVINREVNYLDSVDKIEILPGVPKAIKILNDNHFKVVVITNQSGVARGFFSEDTLREIHEHIENKLKEHSASIDAIYYCPHHPDEGCECRKPKTELIKRAEMDLDLDLSRSYLVGDTANDVRTGLNARLKTILVLTGYGEAEQHRLDKEGIKVDFIAKDLLSAVHWIIGEGGR
jgi:D,D-heptose 1,7-bisphosphate phosphatase